MKTFFTVLFILLSVSSYSQGIVEEKILSFNKHDISNSYDFYYDINSGSYTKLLVDSVKDSQAILSNNGTSKYYGYIEYDNLIFDSDGNYYVISGNNLGNDNTEAFFIKNGNEICKYDDIDASIISDGKIIYFKATKNKKSFIVKYDIKKETLTEGKKYDYIKLYSAQNSDIPESGFSLRLSRKGNLFYVASLAGKEFMVINDAEQKSYKSIDLFNVTEDKEGNICYIAKETDDNGTFSVIVQGEIEYKKRYFANGPILFTNDNIPVYLASDTFNTKKEIHYLYTGNEKGKYYEKGISNVTISKGGDIEFIASDTINVDKICYFVVANGEEGKKYENIYNLIFSDENEPLYVAEQDGKCFAAGLGKEYRTRYSRIFSLCVSPEEKLCYVGQNFADSANNKDAEFYYHLGEKVFGPYAAVPNDNDFSETSLFVFNESWRYAFVAGEYSPTSKDTIVYKVHTESFESDGFDYIDGLTFYEGDLYYYTYQSSNNLWSVYRNKVKTGGDFEAINDFKVDKDDGVITYTGYRKGAIYFVKIDLE